jgi:chemotaxis protein methyltransferase CheR
MRRGAAAAFESHDEVLVANEFPLTVKDFGRIAKLLYAETGIHLTPAKASLVYSRLAKRVRDLRLSDFSAYSDLIASESGRTERLKMCAALTTNVTRFFREPHHFKHFAGIVAPGLLKSAERGGRVRVWSAACSSGQEPYSIALSILGASPEAPSYDVKILATDFNAHKLAEGRQGTYPADELSDVPADLRSRWVRQTARDRFEVAPEARALVSFRELNLNGKWPMRGKFEVIFCRNVVIYFDEPTRDRLWARFADSLEAGGYLYIGHSERVSGQALRYFDSTGVTIYRRNARRSA